MSITTTCGRSWILVEPLRFHVPLFLGFISFPFFSPAILLSGFSSLLYYIPNSYLPLSRLSRSESYNSEYEFQWRRVCTYIKRITCKLSKILENQLLRLIITSKENSPAITFLLQRRTWPTKNSTEPHLGVKKTEVERLLNLFWIGDWKGFYIERRNNMLDG